MNRTSKKITAFLLATGLVVSSAFFANQAEASTKTFSDLQEDHWAYNAIQEATKLGYVKGNEDGTYKPEKHVSRAEFAQFFARVLDSEERVAESFTDVSDSYWGKAAIEEMLAVGVIDVNDYPKGKFNPDGAMTRSEIAKWLTKALAVENKTYLEIEKLIRTSPHTIIPTTEFYRGGITKEEQGYIGVMLGTGLFNGYTDGSFKPNGNTTRSEVATLLVRFKHLAKQEPTSLTGLNEIVEVSKTATNMTSISPFIYRSEDLLFSNVTNKWVNYGSLGQMQLHQAIFVPYGSYEEVKKSIYGKMFVDEDSMFFENSYEVFVHKSFKPKYTTNVSFLSFIGSSNDVFYASHSPQMRIAKQYNYAYLPNTKELSFTKDKTLTYWSSFGQRVGSGEGNGTSISYKERFAYYMK